MAHLVKQKEAAPPPPVISASLAKQMKKSGFVVPQASLHFHAVFFVTALFALSASKELGLTHDL